MWMYACMDMMAEAVKDASYGDQENCRRISIISRGLYIALANIEPIPKL